MERSIISLSLRSALALGGGLALLAACGGGGGGTTPGGGPTPCPPGFGGVAPACTSPTSASGTISVGTQPSNATLPAVGGYSSTLQLPSASVAASVAVTTSTQAPAGIVAVMDAARRPQAVANAALLYFAFTPSANVTLNGVPGFTVTLPSGVSTSQSFYIALYQNGAWRTIAGPGTVSGSTVTFASSSGTIVLTAQQTIYFAFYAGAVLPSPAPTASPSALSFPGTGSGHAQQLTVTENGYAGAFTSQINDCSQVVGVAPPSGTTFTVTPNAPGTCTLRFADAFGSAAAVPVTVTVTQVGGQ